MMPSEGVCPECKCLTDVKKSTPLFTIGVSGKKVLLIFAFCEVCSKEMMAGSKQKFDSNAIQAVREFYAAPDRRNWLVVTSLEFSKYHGDFYLAWYWGIDLPKEVFDLINDGLIESVSFPGGQYVS